MIIEKNKRQFLNEDLIIQSWEDLKPYFDDLLAREIDSKQKFERWLNDRSELDAVLEEDLAGQQRVADLGIALHVGIERASHTAAATAVIVLSSSARTAMCGPRSDPPMPMFTTSVICASARMLSA